jgi:hypothetical protein
VRPDRRHLPPLTDCRKKLRISGNFWHLRRKNEACAVQRIVEAHRFMSELW